MPRDRAENHRRARPRPHTIGEHNLYVTTTIGISILSQRRPMIRDA